MDEAPETPPCLSVYVSSVEERTGASEPEAVSQKGALRMLACDVYELAVHWSAVGRHGGRG